MRLMIAGLAAIVTISSADLPLAQIYSGGRTITNVDGSATFGWPATYFEFGVRGSDFTVVVDAPRDRLRVLVDDVEAGELGGRLGPRFESAHLPGGTHKVRLEKLAETQNEPTRLVSVTVPKGSAIFRLPRTSRQIEFIGDSYTVGYGDMSPKHACSPAELLETTNSQLAYGPVLSKRLDYDYRVIAFSGEGLIRNYAGANASSSMMKIYDRPLPSRSGAYVDATWHPSTVVINLGNNDFSARLGINEKWKTWQDLSDDYVNTYVAFVSMLAIKYNNPRFILMAASKFELPVSRVVQALSAKQPMLSVHQYKYPKLELTGCGGHPSVVDQARLADGMLLLVR